MKNKLIDKAWEKNAKYLHSLRLYLNKEIHHIFNRRKNNIAKCCLRLLVPAEPMHQDNWLFVGQWRDLRRCDYILATDNYTENIGCKKVLWDCCKNCAMPKIGGSDGQ